MSSSEEEKDKPQLPSWYPAPTCPCGTEACLPRARGKYASVGLKCQQEALGEITDERVTRARIRRHLSKRR